MMNWMISKTISLQLPRFGAVSVAHGVVRFMIIDSSGSIDTNWPFNKLKEMLIRHLTMSCLNNLLQRMTMHFGRRGVKDIVHPV